MGGSSVSTFGAVMKMVIVAAAFLAGGLAFAAPAVGAPPTTVDCSNPCVAPAAPALTGAPWTDFFATYAPWEKVFDPNGDGQGAWEKGVQAVNGGAWEKVFPPAP